MKGVCEYHTTPQVFGKVLSTKVRADGAVCTRTELLCTTCGRVRGIRFNIARPGDAPDTP